MGNLRFFNRELDPYLLSNVFKNDDPFDNIVIDDFLKPEIAENLLQKFPIPDESWWKYDNPLEKKFAYNDLSRLDSIFKHFFDFINSKEITKWLSILSGIEDLCSDETLLGGGLRAIKKGGKLDIHEDFNVHKETKKYRKLNLILYLNKNWNSEWEGNLELWDKNMERMFKTIEPVFNRLVIFRTDMGSNHGHPHPLKCPDSEFRKSLASYYYSEKQLLDPKEHRSTFYKPLPGIDDGYDEIRQLRLKGRLNSK